MMDFLSGLGPTPARTEQLSRFTGPQQGAINQILGSGLQGLQQNKMDFAPIAAQAREQFQQQTIPSIAERFTSMGGGGGRSSAFGQQLGAAGAGLESSLAALGSQYGLQRQGQLQNLLGLGLTPSFENIYMPSQPGFLGSLAGAAAPGLGSGLISLLLSLLGGR